MTHFFGLGLGHFMAHRRSMMVDPVRFRLYLAQLWSDFNSRVARKVTYTIVPYTIVYFTPEWSFTLRSNDRIKFSFSVSFWKIEISKDHVLFANDRIFFANNHMFHTRSYEARIQLGSYTFSHDRKLYMIVYFTTQSNNTHIIWALKDIWGDQRIRTL